MNLFGFGKKEVESKNAQIDWSNADGQKCKWDKLASGEMSYVEFLHDVLIDLGFMFYCYADARKSSTTADSKETLEGKTAYLKRYAAWITDKSKPATERLMYVQLFDLMRISDEAIGDDTGWLSIAIDLPTATMLMDNIFDGSEYDPRLKESGETVTTDMVLGWIMSEAILKAGYQKKTLEEGGFWMPREDEVKHFLLMTEIFRREAKKYAKMHNIPFEKREDRWGIYFNIDNIKEFACFDKDGYFTIGGQYAELYPKYQKPDIDLSAVPTREEFLSDVDNLRMYRDENRKFVEKSEKELLEEMKDLDDMTLEEKRGVIENGKKDYKDACKRLKKLGIKG